MHASRLLKNVMSAIVFQQPARLAVLVFFALLLAGCGNRGDLYLPGQVTDKLERAEQEKRQDESGQDESEDEEKDQ